MFCRNAWSIRMTTELRIPFERVSERTDRLRVEEILLLPPSVRLMGDLHHLLCHPEPGAPEIRIDGEPLFSFAASSPV